MMKAPVSTRGPRVTVVVVELRAGEGDYRTRVSVVIFKLEFRRTAGSRAVCIACNNMLMCMMFENPQRTCLIQQRRERPSLRISPDSMPGAIAGRGGARSPTK